MTISQRYVMQHRSAVYVLLQNMMIMTAAFNRIQKSTNVLIMTKNIQHDLRTIKWEREREMKKVRQIYLIRSWQYADSRSSNSSHSNFNFSTELISVSIQTSSFKILSVDRVFCSQKSVSSQAITDSDNWITVSNKHQK